MGASNGAHILDTLVPVEEPSTASRADMPTSPVRSARVVAGLATSNEPSHRALARAAVTSAAGAVLEGVPRLGMLHKHRGELWTMRSTMTSATGKALTARP